MRRRTLPAAGPLYIFVIAYPIMWALGFNYFLWPLVGVLFGLPLVLNRPVRVPPAFGLWLLFLVWMLLSVVEVDKAHRLAVFGWRASIYLTATIVFLWIFNLPRHVLTDRSVTGAMVVLWVAIVIGGIAGVAAPSVSWHSYAESVLPKSVLDDRTGHAFVHPALTDVKFRALGYPLGRPKALFAYTNQWGAAIGMLTPFAIAAIAYMRRGVKRSALIALLIASIIPIIVSLNRGLWLALLIALVYVAFRLMQRGNAQLFVRLMAAISVVGVALVVSPLGSVLHARVSSKENSNATRAAIYSETISEVRKSPLFGFGSPRPTQSDIITGAHIGTQGQFYLVLFSHGVPGAVFFLAFFAIVFARSCRGPVGISTLWNVVLVIAAVEMFFYDFIPASMFLIMVAAALASRAAVAGEYAIAPVPRIRTVQPLPAKALS
ncbi:MAG: hypothetical protein QOJ13_1694 [Gaiellales bacterium]|jgi:hypothetical protein|nr:hypothetical protein [Gaiellales bacterium]